MPPPLCAKRFACNPILQARTPLSPRSSVSSATPLLPSEEARTGAALAKRKTDLQASVFATNSGKRLRKAGDLDGAISQYRAAINSTPAYAPAHYELGLALLQQGKKEEASQEFQKAASLDPKLVPPQI